MDLQILSSLSFTLYLFAISTVLALLEIQIEGANGWASALPTWRVGPKWLLRLTSGKPITGYHVWFNSLLLLFLHVPFWFARWSWAGECMVGGTYFLMAVQWDFLWFVLNPHFGVSRFTKANVWWFQDWWLGLPTGYYAGILLSLASWLAAAALEGAPLLDRARRWLTCLVTLLALTTGAMLCARWRSSRSR